MEQVYVTPQTVQLAKDILQSGIDGKFPPFKECFEWDVTVVAKHELYEQYRDFTGCQIPKVFVYIVMDQLFGVPAHKDAKGNLGYKLKFKLHEEEKSKKQKATC
jgi:hypothetical protein